MSICVPGTTSFKLILVLLKIEKLYQSESIEKPKNHTSYLNNVELLTAYVEVETGSELNWDSA